MKWDWLWGGGMWAPAEPQPKREVIAIEPAKEPVPTTRWQRAIDTFHEWLGYAIGIALIVAMMLVPLWLVIWLQGVAGDAKAARSAEAIAAFTIGLVALLWRLLMGVAGLLPDWIWYAIGFVWLFRLASDHFRSIVREELDRRKEQDAPPR